MPKIIRLLFTLLTLSLTACIDEDDLYKDNTPENNFEALWKIIDTQYCFHDYKTEQGCLPWDSVYLKYQPRIDNTMTQDQLFEVLCDMLAELKDGHVNLYSASDVGRYWSWYEDYPANFDADILDVYLGTDYKIASGITYKIFSDNIGYMRCESFSDGIGEGNLDEVMDYLKLCTGLIVDVRDNSGGELDNAETLAQRFTNEKTLVGYIAHKTGTGHSDFSDPEAEYIEPSDGIRWQKPVVLLTNRACYSATNTFVRDMKEFDNIIQLGDSTGGGSGLPFSSELPNGWGVRFSACPMYDADMNQIEFGIAPDTAVALTSADSIRNTDTLIEAAREILKQ